MKQIEGLDPSMGSRIRELRLKHGMTQQELGDKLGVQNSAIHKYEKGLVVNLKRDTVTRMAELFGVTPAYILGVSDDVHAYGQLIPLDGLTVRRLPLIGSVAAGTPIPAEEDHEAYIDCDSELRADYALKVAGHSMEPTYLPGDILYIRSQPDVREGAIAVVLIDDSATLKHVYHDPEGVTLVSDNPQYPPMRFDPHNSDSIRILGIPVGFTRIY